MLGGRAPVEPPMRATSAAKKDGSITVTTFGHGGGDSPSPGARR